MFIIIISPSWVVAKIIDDVDDLKKMGNIYIKSTFFLCALGWLQMLVFYFTGVDIVPNGIVSDLLGVRSDSGISAMMKFEGETYFRMNSLGGEPKDFGATTLSALIIVLISYLYFENTKYLLFFICFFLVTLYFTYSSTTYFIFIIAFLTTIVGSLFNVLPNNPFYKLHRMYLMVFGAVLTGLLVMAIIAGETGNDIMILNVIYARTFGRLKAEEEKIGQYFQEDFDKPIIDMLLDNPEVIISGVGLGNAHIYSDNYIVKVVSLYAGNTVFVAKRGYLRWISEIGIIGLVLFIVWMYVDLFKLNTKIVKRYGSPEWSAFLTSLSIVMFISFLLSCQFVYILFILMGMILATVKIRNIYSSFPNNTKCLRKFQ